MSNDAGWAPAILELVAKGCLQVHALRTVHNVAQDLAPLQSVCKASSNCASSVWQTVAKRSTYNSSHKSDQLKAKDLKRSLPAEAQVADTVLEQAVKFPSEQLTVFIQTQWDKHVTEVKTKAKKDYRLTDIDLLPLAHKLKHNMYKPSAPVRLYYTQDLIALANKNWGGLEGFLRQDKKARQAADKRASTKKAKGEASDEGKADAARKAQKAEARATAAPAHEQALTASLAKHGLQLERGFRQYKTICAGA